MSERVDLTPLEALTPEARELKAELGCFGGTEGYQRHVCGASEDSTSGWTVYLTDGAVHLAERGGCYWLMDLIASTLPRHEWDTFVTATLELEGEGGTLSFGDGNGKTYHRQTLPFCDFPFPSFTLYAAHDALLDGYVVMLPSEY